VIVIIKISLKYHLKMEPNKMIKDVNTDHAWKVVHQRLQDDGLIPVDSRDTEMAARLDGWLMRLHLRYCWLLER
jgi:hypothetical protein